ncbi:DUF4926 domain-containing protein [Lamprocystis purpurea]|uniref:DUF4926 domain-containing protein n=1 Tax=Lamprocystis purpurea TaxID=61598 RepID=UPI000A0766F7|nr:DUF4926 domain-containing protein [Lamprocystis purpurea]
MNQAIKLFDVVALTTDLPEIGLVAGQVGTVVEPLGDEAYEVEFIAHRQEVGWAESFKSAADGRVVEGKKLHAYQLLALGWVGQGRPLSHGFEQQPVKSKSPEMGSSITSRCGLTRRYQSSGCT